MEQPMRNGMCCKCVLSLFTRDPTAIKGTRLLGFRMEIFWVCDPECSPVAFAISTTIADVGSGKHIKADHYFRTWSWCISN